jgi:hypothetical protein
MKRTIILAAAALGLAAPAIGQEQPSSSNYALLLGTTAREKLTQERRDGNTAERRTRERVFSTAPVTETAVAVQNAAQQPSAQAPVIIINNQPATPAITINNNNNNTNTNPVNVTSTLQSQQAIGAAAPSSAPLRPGCALGIVTNLGLDQFGRPIFANLRAGPGVQFGNVPGPDLTPVILPDGVKVSVCGRQGRWLSVEIQTAVAPIQGWVFDRYVGAP